MPRRRLLPFALVAAGFVAVVTVLGLTGADGGWIASIVRTAPKEPTPEELTAAAPTTNAAAGGPTLRPSETAKPRVEGGPITVYVVDRAGTPVAGVCVLAVQYARPNKDGTTTQEKLRQAFTDAAGRARVPHLAHTGRVIVGARARAAGDPAELGGLGRHGWRQISGARPRQQRAFEVAPLAEGGEGRALEPIAPFQKLATDTMTQFGYSYRNPDDPSDPSGVRAGPIGVLLAGTRVTGPEVTLVIDRGLPLDLQVREAGEGRLCPDARWQVRPQLAWKEAAYGVTTLPVVRGKPAHVSCRVKAPDGLVGSGEAEWKVLVHPQAQRFVAVYPLRPPVDVLLLFPRTMMPYTAGDWQGSVTVAGVKIEARDVHVDAQGRLCVRGGAHVVGDLVHVSGSIAQCFLVNGVGHIGPDPRQPVLVEVAVTPCLPTPTVEGDAGYTWDIDERDVATTDEAQRPRVLVTGVLPDGPRIDPAHAWAEAQVALQIKQLQIAGLEALVRAHPESGAPLPVRAMAWDGGPAAGAVLWLGGQERVADTQGRAIFRDVRTGPASILVLGAGAATFVDLEVGAAPRSEALLTARVGGTIDVEVVDAKGRPLPYARVEFTSQGGGQYMDCVDGVQRLDSYTDASGRRTYRAVAAGLVQVHAAFGTRSAEGHVALSDGGREVVRIEMPVHGPPPPPADEPLPAK